MIKCAHCHNTVDETKRASCPVCLAPLAVGVAPPGQGVPGFVPPPGAGAMPPARAPQSPPPAMPYAPPPGSPYSPPAPATYAPPPGSPYVTPPLSGAPPLPTGAPQSVPGYGPPPGMRTTLTGEVVPTSAPTPYPHGAYTPPGAGAYGNGYSMPISAPQQAAPPAKRGWSGANWKLAGGGSFTALYVIARLIMVFTRTMHPSTPEYNYTSSGPSSVSAGMSMPSSSPPHYYTAPVVSQPTMPNPPNFPTGPRFQFHGPMHGMPTAPGGFSGSPSVPGQGSFGMPPGSRFGNRFGNN